MRPQTLAARAVGLDLGGRLVDGGRQCRFARAARQWIGPFRDSFADVRMEITGLIADEEKVAVHLRCSDTHLGQWRGHQPSGLRFWGVDEIYIYRVRGGRLVAATGVEDNPARMRQLGLPA
jgi:predicted ester cyclase